MVNLTRGEAQTRSASISVDGYQVDLDLTLGEQFFGSHTTIDFTSHDRQPTFIEVEPQSLHSVRLNGRAIDPDSWRNGRVHLAPDRSRNTVEVEATMSYSHDGEGLHRYVDPADKRVYTYAMSFLDAAPRIFACFDQPDLKAPYELTVKAPDPWVVVGNGPARRVGPGRWEIRQDRPLATYFVTLVAGEYHQRTAEHDGIPLGLLCRASLAEHLDRDVDEMFRTTAQAFDEFHRLFRIRYPFGEYHQAFVPEFNASAMENPGCVTFRDQHIFDSPPSDDERAERSRVIVHEMAHQWFGDLVTMRWWDDLWLNESFAEYMAYRVSAEATDFPDAWLEFTHDRKPWGMRADQLRSTHPVAGVAAPDSATALDNFDGISYAKGTAVLKQLATYLGDDAFLAGVRDHLEGHAYDNATFADIVASWSVHGGDLDDWVTSWLRTAGIDLIEPAPDGDPGVVVHSASPQSPRTHAFTVARVDDAARDDRAVTLRESAALDLPPGGVLVPDARDDTWARIRLAADPAEIAAMLVASDDAVLRSVVWASLRESVYEGVVDPADWLWIAGRSLPGETSDVAVEAVLRKLLTARGRYLHGPGTDAALERLTLDLLDAATPNRQLIAVRGQLAVTRDDELLTSWIGGDSPVSDVPPSTDLAWRAMYRRVTNGDVGADDVERLLQQNTTTTTLVHSYKCRAALPDAATKKDVWDAITTDEELSNHPLYAYCEGFWQPGQEELTDPYVARYFAEFPATGRFRSGWIVGSSAADAFPAYALSERTAELADALAADTSVLPGVRRAASDGADDLRRVLHSRAVYADR